MEGDLEIKEYEFEVGEVNLINQDNILMRNKDRRYKCIKIRSVQVPITALQYYGKDINLYGVLCDFRGTKI